MEKFSEKERVIKEDVKWGLKEKGKRKKKKLKEMMQ